MANLTKKENDVFFVQLNEIELLFSIQAINWVLGEIMPEKQLKDLEVDGHCTALVILNQRLSKNLDTVIEKLQRE